MAAARHWLVKSEPDVYSIDDLKRDRRTGWDGVRNYQARNFMRDEMKRGDLVVFYHSGKDAAAVGVAKVAREAHPDETALDPRCSYHDPKATKENPIWMKVDLAFVEKFPQPVPLATLRTTKGLDGMPLLKRGQRLSVMPVSAAHFRIVRGLGGGTKG